MNPWQTNSEPPAAVEVFPDGRPVPPVLTGPDVVVLLRLGEAVGSNGKVKKRPLADSLRSLERLRQQKGLRSMRVGENVVYDRDDVLAFARGQRPPSLPWSVVWEPPAAGGNGARKKPPPAKGAEDD